MRYYNLLPKISHYSRNLLFQSKQLLKVFSVSLNCRQLETNLFLEHHLCTCKETKKTGLNTPELVPMYQINMLIRNLKKIIKNLKKPNWQYRVCFQLSWNKLLTVQGSYRDSYQDLTKILTHHNSWKLLKSCFQ